MILGATGGSGGATAMALAARGWTIRALSRNAASARTRQPGFDWRQGDAMVAADVQAAAEGVDVIVHAVNPPGYQNWGKLILPMIDNTIAAAKATGARIVVPGNVYNYGPDAFPTLKEDSPQHPNTVKGALRVEMEARLKHAADQGTPVLILRAGDFFGPGAANNWFSQGMVTPGKPVKAVNYPGKAGIGHQWAYLPDFGETVAQLLERGNTLDNFAVYHMDGIWDADGRQMIGAIESAIGRKVKVRGFPWFALPLLSPFVALFRELREMRYLWAEPIRMDNAKLIATLGEEPHTPIDIAVRKTLTADGCIGPAAPSGARRAEQLMFLA
jgi:nucleoside-diphosphate-sugar epimerase